MRSIVLASGSAYRRQLLEKLGLDFDSHSPEIDETPYSGEPPRALAARLARLKASALRERYSDALIIGSDQVASLDDTILGKPGNHQRALEQLKQSQGRQVQFYTGLCLLDSRSGEQFARVETYEVQFRSLSEEQLENYLVRDEPYDCAGSFKCESLGIALFTAMRGDDPNTLVGLPLIALTHLLAQAGVDVLGA